MTPENFVYWLQGFFELSGYKSLNEKQVQMIQDHLALVFNKVTPDRTDFLCEATTSDDSSTSSQEEEEEEEEIPFDEITPDMERLLKELEEYYTKKKPEPSSPWMPVGPGIPWWQVDDKYCHFDHLQHLPIKYTVIC